VTGAGTWQYQLASGGSFVPFPKVSVSNALLLGPNDLIHFVPTSPSFVGAVTLTAHAWDGTGGFTDGGTTNLSKKGSTGGSTPFSSTLESAKLYFNHAPTQTAPAGGINLGSINENTTSKTVTVTTLVKTDALATDADKGAKIGMAITGVTGLGVWQYRLTSTSAWLTVPASVSATSALLLPSTAQLHFVPKADQTGTASLSWLAWDGTQGTAGQTFNASVTGGATAFGSTTATATLTINPVTPAPAPAWVGSGAVLTPVLPGSTLNTITPSQVSIVFGPFFSDPSATTIGIAITGLSGTKSGTWKFSTDGGTTWTTMPAVSAKTALLLSGNDLIAFVPNAGFQGTVTLTAHAWDGVGGTHGTTANLATAHATGGSTNFSATTLTATELVNNSPVLLS
jgi:trimeric autotransporter adhesin